MSQDITPAEPDEDRPPPADRRRLVAAGLLLALPVLALMWVGSYARVEPRWGGFPFFVWYQLIWVFASTACTYAAYRLVLHARRTRRQLDHGEPR